MPYTIEDLLDRERRRWMKPNAHLYMRPDAHRFTRSDAYTCGYSSKAIGGYQEACRKAGFDPDQPRVPAGRPDAGQWISGGGTTGWEANPNRNRLAARSPKIEAACLLQYRQDTFICNAVGLRSCWQQAALRYANCLAGLPIPPLVF